MHSVSVFSPSDLGTGNETSFYPFQKSCDLDQHMTYLTKKPELIFTVTFDKDEVKLVLDSLSDTVTECKNLIKPGYYRSENIVAHYLLGNNRSDSVQLIFEDEYVKRHKNVLVLQNMLTQGDIEMSRYDIYSNKVHHLIENSDTFVSSGWFADFPMNVSIKS